MRYSFLPIYCNIEYTQEQPKVIILFIYFFTHFTNSLPISCYNYYTLQTSAMGQQDLGIRQNKLKKKKCSRLVDTQSNNNST